MQHEGEDVAYLAYTMNERPVSLLVTASERIVPNGQEVYRSGNLLFHFSAHKGLKLITWRDRNLVYALVRLHALAEKGPNQDAVPPHAFAR